MIITEQYKIVEPQDVVQACDNIAAACTTIAEGLRKKNYEGQGEQDYADFMGDLYVVLTAAGVGAAVCKQQAGIVALKEGATDEDKAAAVAALEELRKKASQKAETEAVGGLPS